MQLNVKKGATDRSVYLYIIDATDGTPEQGVNYATSGLALWYRRPGAAAQAVTPVELADLTTAHADGGIIHIDDGLYRVDVPDAAFATGVPEVVVGGACTGMIVLPVCVALVNFDPEDGVRLGLTALPNAAADAAGGLTISDAGGLDLDAKLAATNEITAARAGALTDWINGGRLDLLLDAVKAKTDALPADPADESALEAAMAGLASLIADCAVPGDAMTLTSDERIALFARTLDGLSIDSILKTLLSHAVGKLNGAPSGPLNFRNVGDTKNVIVLTADANGNRSSVVLDP